MNVLIGRRRKEKKRKKKRNKVRLIYKVTMRESHLPLASTITGFLTLPVPPLCSEEILQSPLSVLSSLPSAGTIPQPRRICTHGIRFHVFRGQEAVREGQGGLHPSRTRENEKRGSKYQERTSTLQLPTPLDTTVKATFRLVL